MFHYIYKTTNLITGTYYIGKHTSKSLENDYLGSGLILSRSIKKYGLENFKKEVLFVLNSEKEAYQKEAEIVTEDLIKDSNCMNLRIGGNGGYKGSSLPEEIKRKISEALKGSKNPNYRKPKSEKFKKRISEVHSGKKVSEETREKISKAKKGQIPWHKGKTNVYSKETLEKMSESHKGQIPWIKGKIGYFSHSEESRQKIGENGKGWSHMKGKIGEKCHNYGKKHSEETKNILREKSLGRKHSEETKKKIGEASLKMWQIRKINE